MLSLPLEKPGVSFQASSTLLQPTTPTKGGGGQGSSGSTPSLPPPGEPSLTLEEDTGLDPSDGIRYSGTILVSGLEPGATWEYSLNHGTTWQAGSVDTLILNEDGTYEVVARQTRQYILLRGIYV